jgi:predicted small secreted protein
MRKVIHSFAALVFVIGFAACANTARGVVEDTKDNTSAVRGGIETVDVKTAIIADKTIDSGAIDVDTYQDKKVVVLRGSVPTAEQKARAERIARDNAKGYTVENRLAVVPQEPGCARCARCARCAGCAGCARLRTRPYSHSGPVDAAL